MHQWREGVGTPICKSAYLRIWGTTKSQKNQEKSRKNHLTPSEKMFLRVLMRICVSVYFLKKSEPEHELGIKTMTSLILDHVATAYLYLGINTREKVMILFVVIVLELSQDSSWLNKHAPRSSLL
jgi:hypothetical protein